MAPVDFVQGTLDVVVLQAVAHGPVHGYDVARFIHEHSDGTLRVLDGALYTALHRLEARGWIAGRVGPLRERQAGEVLPADDRGAPGLEG